MPWNCEGLVCACLRSNIQSITKRGKKTNSKKTKDKLINTTKCFIGNNNTLINYQQQQQPPKQQQQQQHKGENSII